MKGLSLSDINNVGRKKLHKVKVTMISDGGKS